MRQITVLTIKSICVCLMQPADRRVRLQQVIAEMQLGGAELDQVSCCLHVCPEDRRSLISSSSPPSVQLQATMNRIGEAGQPLVVGATAERQKETVYTQASAELVDARTFVAEYSFDRSRTRLQELRRVREDTELARQHDEQLAALYKHSKEITLNGTQFGDERPLMCIRYNPDGTRLAAGSLSAHVQFFNAKTLDNIGTLRGHTQRVTKLNWHPEAVDANPTPLIATGSADAKAMLWNARDGTMIHTFKGHKSNISGVDFHPSGRILGTVSHDTTMRLWDVEAGTELLLQDGE